MDGVGHNMEIEYHVPVLKELTMSQTSIILIVVAVVILVVALVMKKMKS